jgi:hypothetical protein
MWFFPMIGDDWIWKLDPEEEFSVNSAYEALSGTHDDNTFSEFELENFSGIWKNPAPSKVVAFSWQLLHDRLPMKDSLVRRGILQHHLGGNCVWCVNFPESANHLFLHCSVAHRVWYKIFRLLGVVWPRIRGCGRAFFWFGIWWFGRYGVLGTMQFLMVSRWSGWKLWKILNSYLGSGVWIV